MKILFTNFTAVLSISSIMPARLMLISNDVFKESKGAFTEDYVMQQLVNRGRSDLGIYYFSKDNSMMEIDFLIQTEERVIPLEVKAEENVHSKSLRTFVMNEFADKHLKGLRCSMRGYIDQEWMENIPLYAVGEYIGD